MSPISSNFYANWRAQWCDTDFLRETDPPPEKLLQSIWHHQRLQREHLKSLDGRPVRVLHPGFWNREAGPDFRQAVLKVGDEILTGDIEIDLQDAGWRGHGHDRNPNFSDVILHVVWEGEGKNISLPVLALKPFLDAPLREIAVWIGSEAGQGSPSELRGQCCAPMRALSREKMAELLQQAAKVRFERKAQELGIRARSVGWKQALYEGLFRALGYKQNVWPMRRVSEILPQIPEPENSVLHWQARLLGVSGLLPDELSKGTSANDYLRKIWECWWREREQFSDFILPRTVWKFNSLRPANHPQRRLALASHWLANPNFLRDLECWFVEEISARETALQLWKILQAEADEFWSSHATFRSNRLPKKQPLIGQNRVTDLAINVILPWFWIRSVAGKNLKLQRVAEERFFSWPAAEDNSVLRLARERLLAKNEKALFGSASAQQGLLQIVRDFCEHSNALCTNCRFPDLIRQWSSV